VDLPSALGRAVRRFPADHCALHPSLVSPGIRGETPSITAREVSPSLGYSPRGSTVALRSTVAQDVHTPLCASGDRRHQRPGALLGGEADHRLGNGSPGSSSQQVNQSREAAMKPLRSVPLRSITRAVLVGRIKLRPEPGSRVTLIPTHTQGAGMPVSGLPVKSKSVEKRRIDYPPRQFNQCTINHFTRGVTRP
jgi:hypothetical protein